MDVGAVQLLVRWWILRALSKSKRFGGCADNLAWTDSDRNVRIQIRVKVY